VRCVTGHLLCNKILYNYGVASDPPENCHLTVKKLPKTWHFSKKIVKNCYFFQINCHCQFWKKSPFLAIFWHSNGNIFGGLGSHHYVFVHLGLMEAEATQSGQRQVGLPFLKPHLVTVTDTRQTSRKCVVNVFPKDITKWPVQDLNPGPSTPNSDSLIARPHRSQLQWH